MKIRNIALAAVVALAGSALNANATLETCYTDHQGTETGCLITPAAGQKCTVLALIVEMQSQGVLGQYTEQPCDLVSNQLDFRIVLATNASRQSDTEHFETPGFASQLAGNGVAISCSNFGSNIEDVSMVANCA